MTSEDLANTENCVQYHALRAEVVVLGFSDVKLCVFFFFSFLFFFYQSIGGLHLKNIFQCLCMKGIFQLPDGHKM